MSIAVDLDPSTPGIQTSTMVMVNDVVSADIVVSGIVDDPFNPFDGLNAFEFDVDFDPSVVSATSVVDGGFLLAPIFVVESDTAGSDVNFAEVTLLPSGAFGSGVLATVTFQALAVGTSVLDLNDVMLSAPFGIPIAFDAVNDGSIMVKAGGPDPIPEPSTILLLGTGLAGLAAWRLRKQQVS